LELAIKKFPEISLADGRSKDPLSSRQGLPYLLEGGMVHREVEKDAEADRPCCTSPLSLLAADRPCFNHSYAMILSRRRTVCPLGQSLKSF
jgi:hypothetical protein